MIIVGESYGGMRTTAMLQILLNYFDYGNGVEMYQDQALAADIQAHYNIILRLDLGELFRSVSHRIKVVSNIPYNISSPIIELLIHNREIISDAVLMVQKEVARRLLAEPGTKDYGLTTLNLSLCAEGRKLMDIKPGAFNPPPEAMSTVISLIFFFDRSSGQLLLSPHAYSHQLLFTL